jgi:hypothetical protein
MQSFLKKFLQGNITSTLALSLLAYSFSWEISNIISHLFWKTSIPNANSISSLLDFIVPAIFIATAIFWTRCKKPIFQILPIFFIIFPVLVFLNISFFHFKTNNFGDNEQLGQVIEAGQVFSRWMIGSSVLKSIFQSLWLPLAMRGLLPFTPDPAIFIRLAGSLFMCGFSIFILRKFPTRLSIVLPLFVPIWLLLASGYSEYYPFITPVYLCLLIFLSVSDVKNFPPIWMGLLVSTVALLYAGFVPIALFLLLIFFLRNGWKTGLIALMYSGLFAILLIVFLWPKSFPNFFKSYIFDLNLGELNTEYPAYKGNALSNTPFFSPNFIFSLVHLRQLFFMYFWGGGFSPLLLIIGFILTFKNWLHQKEGILNFNNLSVGVLLIWQALSFMIVIPKYGPVNDVDLFFSVYIAFAFVAGLLFDNYFKNIQPEKRMLIQNVVFSAVLGNTAFILMNLIFLGLPTPG